MRLKWGRGFGIFSSLFLGTRARWDTVAPLPKPYPFLGIHCPARLSHHHTVALDETETATEEESGERAGGEKWRKKMATYFTLNTGARIPSVGLGTYKAGPGVVADAITAAVKVFASPSSTLCSECAVPFVLLTSMFRVLLAHACCLSPGLSPPCLLVMTGRVPAHRLRAAIQEREGGNLNPPCN